MLPVAVLVVHVWLLDGNWNDVENARRLLEDQVHLFEGPVARLGEEEVDGGEDKGVYDGEDDVGLQSGSEVRKVALTPSKKKSDNLPGSR